MAATTLTPSSKTSTAALTSTGSYAAAATAANYPYAIYSDTSSGLYDANFVTGAVEQVTFVFRKLAPIKKHPPQFTGSNYWYF